MFEIKKSTILEETSMMEKINIEDMEILEDALTPAWGVICKGGTWGVFCY